MRILLAATASYVPPRGGATRSNLAWLDRLSASGHECRVVCGALPEGDDRQRQLADEGLSDSIERGSGEIEESRHGSVRVLGVRDPARRAAVLEDEIRSFAPDWALVSSEDLAHALLRTAHHAAPGRVIFLAHTPQFFPFGPESWNPSPYAAELVRACVQVIVIGRHMAEYTACHLGRPAAVVHPPIYSQPPAAGLPDFERGLITLVNPCAVKGISIFLEAAGRLPEFHFGALSGWGTTAADRDALAARPNVELLSNTREIEVVLRRTRVLLMPSLWYEGFGLIVMEAMLRGIPVVASDSGGLVEAKQGTSFVIPVQRIERYEPVFDERGLPRPVLPANPVEPWVAALRNLLENRPLYEAESARARAAAEQFVAAVRPETMERLLASLEPNRDATPAAESTASRTAMLASLPPEKRAALLRRVRESRQAGH